LFDEVLDEAEARIDGGLEALDHVCELLDLSLELDYFFGSGVGREGSQERYGQNHCQEAKSNDTFHGVLTVFELN